MSKGPEAFRTISEVAEELDLPQHVLRFWETRFAFIRPMKRGGGRRYYRPDDVDLLRGIRALLYGEGYTIRGVQRILKEQGPRFVIAAARGELSAIPPPADEDAAPQSGPASEAPDDAGEEDAIADPPRATSRAGNGAPHIEPTFDPREFRTPSSPSANGTHRPARPGGLSPDELRRLQATLSDLLELKRLLDQARSG
ncbi:MAG: MerR family transcriptional regulator [Bauldia sp.]